MPSGITHILLAKQIQNKIDNVKIKTKLQAGKSFLIAGAVGPDLPYASIVDNDFLRSQTDLADEIHKNKANLIVIKALKKIKRRYISIDPKDRRKQKERDALFCFFMGFASHIIADGIMHPFVRDFVGDYESNKSDHGELELNLDVIYLNSLTQKTGKAVNLRSYNIHDELNDILTYPSKRIVFEFFSKVVNEVYGYKFTPKKVQDWIEGLHLLFDLSSTEIPRICRGLPFIKNYLTKDFEDLKKDIDRICTLTTKKEGGSNFLMKEVHFLNDCVPQFFKVTKNIIEKGYEYIYNDGSELTEAEMFSINLDTGRDVAFSNDLDKKPKYWEDVA